MQLKIYLKYIIVLILLLGFWGYKNYAPIVINWADKKAEAIIEEANPLANKGQWQKAYYKYSLALVLGQEKNDAWAYNCRGLVSWKRYRYWKHERDFIKALSDYDNAIKLSKTCYGAVLYNKGLLYETKGELETALNFHTEAIQCSPNYAQGYEEKTNILFKLKRYEEAISFGLNALDKFGQSDDLFFRIAYSYEMLGNYKKALEFYNKELKYSNYKSWWTYTNASYCKLMLKDYKGAIEYAQNSINLHSNNIDPYNFITFAALKTGDLKLAEKYNNYAFNIYDKPTYLTYYNYAKIKYLQGDSAGAKKRLEKARKLYEKDTEQWTFEKFPELCDELEIELEK